MQWILELIQALLLQPVIVIGILVAIGYILNNKSAVKVITGTVSAMVGLMMILFGEHNSLTCLRLWQNYLAKRMA